MPDSGREVIGGVDTHTDFHVAAAIDGRGKLLGTASFPADRIGYRQLWGWLGGFGEVWRVGIEGTGAYGAGLSRFLAAAGVEAVEVTRPNRQQRRRHGKTDTGDAIAAARAVLSGEADGKPRGGSGVVESIRQLKLVRDSAIRSRTAAYNQLHALLVTAPDQLRAQLRELKVGKVVELAANFRPGDLTDPTQATRLALKSLARRCQTLTAEIAALDSQLETLVAQTAPPALLEMCGVGTQTAAQLLVTAGSNPTRIGSESSFAALCGSSPVDASSGRHQRHRLNRGGDRQANAALYRIAIVRLKYHQPTRLYMERRLKEGLTKPEVIRCLKRYLARDIQRILAAQPTT